jgi:hypothetical protein
MPRKAKAQRTDLTETKVTVPGQDYGKQVAQARAMQSVPMANQMQQAQAMAKMAASAPTTPQAMPQAPSAPLALLSDPTQRPMEPLTHGLPVGPGAGPEAIGPTPQSPISAILGALADGPYATPALENLASYAKNLGF